MTLQRHWKRYVIMGVFGFVLCYWGSVDPRLAALRSPQQQDVSLIRAIHGIDAGFNLLFYMSAFIFASGIFKLLLNLDDRAKFKRALSNVDGAKQ